MGLLTGYLLKKAAVAAGVVVYSKTKKKHGEDGIIKNLEFDNYLYIDKKSLRNSFKVYDKDSRKKYNVSSSFGECTLFKDNGIKIGSATFYKSLPSYYNIELYGEEVGELKQHFKLKEEYTLSNKNWTIKRKSLFDINVKSEEETIIKIHDVIDKNRIIIEYKNIEDEQLALLIFGSLRIKTRNKIH